MVIWFALFVPVLVTGIIWALWPRKLAWWEIPLPIAAAFVLCLIMKLSVEGVQTHDIEYWTGWIHTAEYYEKWTEEWDEYVSEQSHTDENGNKVIDVPAHTEHHIDHHPPEWWMYGSNGEKFSISRESYNRLSQMWHNNSFKKLYHMNQTSWGDGNMYFSNWDQKRSTMVTCTTEHSYKNKVQASKSLFNFRKFKKEEVKELGLFDYPKITDVTEVPSILGDGDAAANRLLQIHNAEMGAAKKVRMWILIFNNADQQVALDQESYWCGGNKNEMILCIGVDKDRNVLWAYPFSWSEEEKLKIEIRQLASGQKKLDLSKIVEGMSDLVQKEFVKKSFKDFDYLTVDPPWGAVLATFILAVVLSLGISTYLLLNEFENDMVDVDAGLAAKFESGTATPKENAIKWASERRSVFRSRYGRI